MEAADQSKTNKQTVTANCRRELVCHFLLRAAERPEPGSTANQIRLGLGFEGSQLRVVSDMSRKVGQHLAVMVNRHNPVLSHMNAVSVANTTLIRHSELAPVYVQ